MSRRAALQPTLWRIDPHTTIKHLVYRHYLGCWMGKVVQRFPRAAIVDGFCGPGEYEGEPRPPGSPIIIANTFLRHSHRARFHDVAVFCQEHRKDRVAHLRGLVDALQPDPRLTIDVRPPGSFPEQLLELSRLAHGADGRSPVLWILDPYNWEPVPFDVVAACLENKKDEILLTFFVDEVYRFKGSAAHERAITTYFGTDEWLPLRDLRDEGQCKRALIELYLAQIRDRCNTYVGHFSIGVKNLTPRYAVIFATHHPAGMECWTPATWRIDRERGEIRTMKRPSDQLDLFAEEEKTPAERLADDLRIFSGSEVRWEVLLEAAGRTWNYLERHLREALDLLADEGAAVRVEPLKSRSSWPEGCVVRFYDPSDVDEA